MKEKKESSKLDKKMVEQLNEKRKLKQQNKNVN